MAELIRRLQVHGFIQRVTINAIETYTYEVEAAVRDFQRARGLGVDGVAGTNTVRLLQAAPTQLPAPRSTEARLGSRTLRLGMEGTDVAELILLLRQTGHLASYVSGDDFTEAVEASVRRFQNAHRLDVDGIAGPETILKLKAETQSGSLDASPAQVEGSTSNGGPLPVGIALGLVALYLYKKSKEDPGE